MEEKDAVFDKASRQLIDLLGDLVARIFAHAQGHSLYRRISQQLVRIEGPVGDFWRKRYKKEKWLDVDNDLAESPLWKD